MRTTNHNMVLFNCHTWLCQIRLFNVELSYIFPTNLIE